MSLIDQQKPPNEDDDGGDGAASSSSANELALQGDITSYPFLSGFGEATAFPDSPKVLTIPTLSSGAAAAAATTPPPSPFRSLWKVDRISSSANEDTLFINTDSNVVREHAALERRRREALEQYEDEAAESSSALRRASASWLSCCLPRNTSCGGCCSCRCFDSLTTLQANVIVFFVAFIGGTMVAGAAVLVAYHPESSTCHGAFVLASIGYFLLLPPGLYIFCMILVLVVRILVCDFPWHSRRNAFGDAGGAELQEGGEQEAGNGETGPVLIFSRTEVRREGPDCRHFRYEFLSRGQKIAVRDFRYLELRGACEDPEEGAERRAQIERHLEGDNLLEREKVLVRLGRDAPRFATLTLKFKHRREEEENAAAAAATTPTDPAGSEGQKRRIDVLNADRTDKEKDDDDFSLRQLTLDQIPRDRAEEAAREWQRYLTQRVGARQLKPWRHAEKASSSSFGAHRRRYPCFNSISQGGDETENIFFSNTIRADHCMKNCLDFGLVPMMTVLWVSMDLFFSTLMAMSVAYKKGEGDCQAPEWLFTFVFCCMAPAGFVFFLLQIVGRFGEAGLFSLKLSKLKNNILRYETWGKQCSFWCLSNVSAVEGSLDRVALRVEMNYVAPGISCCVRCCAAGTPYVVLTLFGDGGDGVDVALEQLHLEHITSEKKKDEQVKSAMQQWTRTLRKLGVLRVEGAVEDDPPAADENEDDDAAAAAEATTAVPVPLQPIGSSGVFF